MSANDNDSIQRTTIQRIRVVVSELEIDQDLFLVTLETARGVCKRQFGSEAELRTWYEGVKDGVSVMGGYAGLLEVPQQPTMTFRNFDNFE